MTVVNREPSSALSIAGTRQRFRSVGPRTTRCEDGNAEDDAGRDHFGGVEAITASASPLWLTYNSPLGHKIKSLVSRERLRAPHDAGWHDLPQAMSPENERTIGVAS
jgi:hypothetical protein